MAPAVKPQSPHQRKPSAHRVHRQLNNSEAASLGAGPGEGGAAFVFFRSPQSREPRRSATATLAAFVLGQPAPACQVQVEAKSGAPPFPPRQLRSGLLQILLSQDCSHDE